MFGQEHADQKAVEMNVFGVIPNKALCKQWDFQYYIGRCDHRPWKRS